MMRTMARKTRHRPLAIALVIVMAVGLYVVSTIFLDKKPTRYFIQPVASTPYLPFDMPNGATTRKVFAHYVPWFPISGDNKPADQDYYTTQYMTPTGENGAHAAYGGLLRDRPLPRAPIANANWKYVDIQTEVGQAKSIGIDGFAVDIVAPNVQNETINQLLTAAASAGAFAIQITPDMAGPLGAVSEAEFAAAIAPYLKSPGAQRLPDGRVVLGAFYAERRPATWWAGAMNAMRTAHGVGEIAFVPTFLDAMANMPSFAAVSYGFSNWGGRNPTVVNPSNTLPGSPIDLIRRARTMGKTWMQPIAFQDDRPRQGSFEESHNAVTNRQSWQIALNERVEWANFITWNDYAETTAIAPSLRHGYRMLDMNAYRIAAFKYGVNPLVIRDALYVSHRTQPFAARPTFPQSLLMNNIGPTPARDAVELEVFSKVPAIGAALIANNFYTCNVPAGFSVCTFPLGLGPIVVGLYYDNAYQVVVQSPSPVTNTPYVQDLQYVVAGGLR